MAYSDGALVYKTNFELEPVTLTGGIASGIPGGVVGALSLLQGITFGGLFGDGDLDPDDAFANFFPIAGSTLVDNQYGNYPFANLTVAANAVIAQPLVVSLLMTAPCRQPGDYATKTYVMTALQNTLAQHCQSGGLFNVATPSFFYANVLLTKLHDVSGGESNQAQIRYQWDFIKPLVTLDDAAGAQNAMMSNLSSGGMTDGSLSGVGNSIGAPSSVAAPEAIPSSTGSIGSGVGVSGAGVPALGYTPPGGAGVGSFASGTGFVR